MQFVKLIVDFLEQTHVVDQSNVKLVVATDLPNYLLIGFYFRVSIVRALVIVVWRKEQQVRGNLFDFLPCFVFDILNPDVIPVVNYYKYAIITPCE